jgi:hypothetical protein
MRKLLRKLRALWSALDVVEWPCYYCQHVNQTPVLLWQTVKYRLICEHCNYALSYPTHIEPHDPLVAPLRDNPPRIA